MLKLAAFLRIPSLGGEGRVRAGFPNTTIGARLYGAIPKKPLVFQNRVAIGHSCQVIANRSSPSHFAGSFSFACSPMSLGWLT